MNGINQNVNGGSVFRVDKFVVPAAARKEILVKVKTTHELLRHSRGSCRISCSSNFRGQANSTW